MIARLRYLREWFNTSIWPIPIGLSVSSALLAILMLLIERQVGIAAMDTGPFAMSLSSARQVVGVIAGSIISVGGVAFSVTVVALTLTSGQYGPKIVRNFLEDDVSKSSLGLFLGTYAYNLVLLAGYNTTDTPHLTVAVSLILAFVTLLAFVRFIHNTAKNLQADEIIHRIGTQLQSALEKLTEVAADGNGSSDTLPWRRRARAHRGYPVAADIQGYVQTIDYSRLVQKCADDDFMLQVRVRAGDFVVEGGMLFKAFGCSQEELEAIADDLKACVLAGPMRTPIQDPEYAITQLNQLAARALSPGINDPGTAITCIDWFCLALSRIIDRDIPGCVLSDSKGVPRVVARVNQLPGIIKAIYGPLRQFGQADVSVSIRLIESLCRLAELTRRTERLEVLAAHGDLIWEQAQHQSMAPSDLQDIGRRHANLAVITDLHSPA